MDKRILWTTGAVSFAALAVLVGLHVLSERKTAVDLTSVSRPHVGADQANVNAPSEIAPPVSSVSKASPSEDGAHTKAIVNVGQERVNVPALPGVEGYELASIMPGGRFAAALAAEGSDPVWAPDMESRLIQAFQKREDLRGLNVKIVCRTTACGLLVVYSSEEEYYKLIESVRNFSVSSELGFNGLGTSSRSTPFGERFTLITLSRARGREQYAPTSQNPASMLPEMPGVNASVSGNIVDTRIQTTDRPAVEQLDRSLASITLEAELRKEAANVGGKSANQFQVECQVSSCSVTLEYPPGGAPTNSSAVSMQLANAVGLSNTSMRLRTGAQGDFLTIYLMR